MTREIDVTVESVSGDEEAQKLSRFLTDVCHHALEEEGYSQAIVSVVLTRDEAVRELNKTFRRRDAVTDVLSFPQLDDAARTAHAADPSVPLVLGDIVVSHDAAMRQAHRFGHGFSRELAYLTVHGLLHLIGYDHEDDVQKAEMRRREEAILTGLDLARGPLAR